jgi:hypothetical protein
MRSANDRKGPARADNALNFMITAELKEALQSTARRCGVNVTDLVRLSLRAMLPVFNSLAQSRELLVSELLIPERRSLRKRHIGIDDEE